MAGILYWTKRMSFFVCFSHHVINESPASPPSRLSVHSCHRLSLVPSTSQLIDHFLFVYTVRIKTFNNSISSTFCFCRSLKMRPTKKIVAKTSIYLCAAEQNNLLFKCSCACCCCCAHSARPLPLCVYFLKKKWKQKMWKKIGKKCLWDADIPDVCGCLCKMM